MKETIVKQVNATDTLHALGGKANITEVEPCISRVRVVVSDPALVSHRDLRKLGALGVVHAGTSVQIVIGPEADILADQLEELIAQ